MSLQVAIIDGVTNRNAASIAKLLNWACRAPQMLSATGKKQITIAAPTVVVLDTAGGPKIFEVAANVTVGEANLDTGVSFQAGKDYSVYLCDNGGNGVFQVSLNATFPAGYTALSSRKIGGFHTLCVNVGSISGHPLSGYLAGEIIPTSVWDLAHRAVGGNEGMAYVAGLDKWFSIYLMSWDGSRLRSLFGGTIADGASTKKFHAHKFDEELGKVGWRLPSDPEFKVAAKGSPEAETIAGSADPVTTGGKTAASGRRIISNFGLEDMTGVMWQWGIGHGSEGRAAAYVNEFDTDAASDNSVAMGQTYNAPNRPIFGGSWGGGAICGSRGASWDNSALSLSTGVGARGVAEPLRRRV